MKGIVKTFLVLFLFISMLSGCGKQEPNNDLENIEMSDVEKIELVGTTGGKDGGYSYFLSDKEMCDFVDLLNRVKLGREVDESEALTSGAVSYYTLCFKDGTTLKISPGKCFEIEDIYYEFENYDELWDEFISFNSLP